jgi:hypothetical protein
MSSVVAISVLTAADDAPGFWGPMTMVGNRKTASQAASLNTSPRMSAALLRRSVTTGRGRAMLGLGRETVD